MLQKMKPLAGMLLVLITCTGLAGIAWQNTNQLPAHGNRQRDTLPEKEREDKTIITGSIDKTIEEVNKARENLEKQMENKDWEKWHRELESSLEKLNTENVQEQVAKALKEIEFQKIQLQAQSALKKIDVEKMQRDIQRAQSELANSLESKKINESLQRAMEESKRAMSDLKAVDMEQLQLQLEKTREQLLENQGSMKENLDRARESMQENLKKDFKKELENARAGIDRAEKELHDYKDMLDEMDKDGLIHAKDAYRIEYKKGDLFINGNKQPDTVTNKYRHYFKKENVKLILEKEGDGAKTIHL